MLFSLFRMLFVTTPDAGWPLSVLMMTSSNGNIFRVTGPLCGEFTGQNGEFPSQRPVTRSFDVFFDLYLNKQLSKKPEAGDLRRHRAHYDIIVMLTTAPTATGWRITSTHDHRCCCWVFAIRKHLDAAVVSSDARRCIDGFPACMLPSSDNRSDKC